MYLHVKIILFIIVFGIAGIFLYSFRGFLPGISLFSKKPETEKISTPPPRPIEPRKISKPEIKKKKVQVKKEQKHKLLEQKFQRAKELFKNQDLLPARNLAENILMDPKIDPYESIWLSAAELISEINTQFLFTGAMCPKKVGYTVAKGDNLIKIANKFNTTVNLIQRSNLLDPTNPNIFPNQVFRIYHGDWNIKVIKNRFILMIMDGESLIKLYHVGTGKQDRTPVGTFIIDVKEFEPDWWRPGKLVPFGEPENVLGTRWLGLAPVEDTNPSFKGYGIHGTWEPETIGHAASLGCVRMVNKQVEELFDIVPTKTRVVIAE